MKRAYNRQEVADALYASVMGGEHMAPTGIDKLLQYEGTIANRGGVLPLMRRVVPDIGGDDISEFEGPLELAAPGLLYDPLSSMAKVGAMATGDMKINPDIITNAAVDAPLMGSLLSGATGAVPRGAVLGANVLPSRFLDDVRPARENIRTVIDANTIGGDVVGDETVPIGLLSGGASSSARAQKAIDDIADSMSGPEGFIERLIVDQDNNVIEGAHRLEALRKLGVDEVPVTRIVDPQASFTPDTKVAMRAAIQKAKKTNSDHENQIISQLGEMLADPDVAGDPKKVFEVYEPAKGFEDQFKAALKSIELGANKAPTAALPGLLDDTASRMQRARDMGFDVDAYHGTDADILRFDPSKEFRGAGVSVAFDPINAAGYGSTVMPLKVKSADLFNITRNKDVKKLVDAVKSYHADNLKKSAYADDGQQNFYPYSLDQVLNGIKAGKSNFLELPEVTDILKKLGFKGHIGREGPFSQAKIFDPQNIRSRFAKFDPAKADSADLLAANP